MRRVWIPIRYWSLVIPHSRTKFGDFSFSMTDLRGLGKVKEALIIYDSQSFSKYSSEPRFPWHLICLKISERASLIIWTSPTSPQICAFTITEHLKHCQYHKPVRNHQKIMTHLIRLGLHLTVLMVCSSMLLNCIMQIHYLLPEQANPCMVKHINMALTPLYS